MRVRYKPWAVEDIREHSHIVIPEPERFKGTWSSRFERNQALHVEIGTGKGRYLSRLATEMPGFNYIGIEKQISVVGMALQKVKALEERNTAGNIMLLHGDAEHLTEWFAPGEIDCIYLNFSDPWPKNRHEKRRLTHGRFLAMYRSVLKKNGEINLKTDNKLFFEYSLNSFSAFGCRLERISLDLHRDRTGAYENLPVYRQVMTEYEQRFADMGQPIYACTAVMP